LKLAMRTTPRKLWRDRAAQARAIARQLEDPAVQKRLAEIADRYDIIADIVSRVRLLAPLRKNPDLQENTMR
jgi:hypothetical protein